MQTMMVALYTKQGYAIFAILLMIQACCSLEIITITTDSSKSKCTGNCYTLSEIPNYEIVSNTVFTLLDGAHYLNFSRIFSSLANLTFEADSPTSDVVIECKENTSLIFDSVLNLVIKNVEFVACGFEELPGTTFQDCMETKLINTTFSKSTSAVLSVINSTLSLENLLVQRNSFTVCYSYCYPMVLFDKKSVITLAGRTRFLHNTIKIEVGQFENEVDLLQLFDNCTKKAAILLVKDHTTIEFEELLVEDNICASGIVQFVSSTLIGYEELMFNYNEVDINGALSLFTSNASLSNNLIFVGNVGNRDYSSGICSTGGMMLDNSIFNMANANISFTENVADVACFELRSASLTLANGILDIFKNRVFPSAKMPYSAVILRHSDIIVENATVYFHEGSAERGLWRVEESEVKIHGEFSFIQNSGTTPLVGRHSKMEIFGNTSFQENPGALNLVNSVISFSGTSNFIENNNPMNSYSQGAISAIGSGLVINGNFRFVRNFANNHVINGGAMYLESSNLLVSGEGIFKENSAHNGGALYLQSRVRIEFLTDTYIRFESNQAHFGAALFASRLQAEHYCIYGDFPPLPCLFRVRAQLHVVFVNNSASSGSIMQFDSLGGIGSNTSEPVDLKDRTITETIGNTQPGLATEEFTLCFCEGNVPICETRELNISSVRGQTLNVSVVSLTRFNNTNEQAIFSYINSNTIGENRRVIGEYQEISNICTELELRVFSTSNSEQVYITDDHLCINNEHCIALNIEFLDCPHGFYLDDYECKCDNRLKKFNAECNIKDETIQKITQNIWVGPYFDNDTYVGLTIAGQCPLNYCLQLPIDVSMVMKT